MTDRASSTEAAPLCPACGADQAAKIVYGLVVDFNTLQPEFEAGRIVLGGCCISGDDPEWQCQACSHRWGRSRQSAEMHDATMGYWLAELARPKLWWQRLPYWLGFMEDDRARFLGSKPRIGLTTRRMACAAASLVLVAIIRWLAGPGPAVFVLFLCFLPLVGRSLLCLYAMVVVLILRLALGRTLGQSPRTATRATGLIVPTVLEFAGLSAALTLTARWLAQ
jgi:hypothetical protein